jgi:hypothetical protein
MTVAFQRVFLNTQNANFRHFLTKLSEPYIIMTSESKKTIEFESKPDFLITFPALTDRFLNNWVVQEFFLLEAHLKDQK